MTSYGLVAREPWRVRVFLLGAYGQSVMVDADAKRITIKRRRFWKTTTRQLLFDHIRAVTYGYTDLAEPYTSAFIASAHDSYDHFAVGLRLTDESDILLFDFVGEGSLRNETGMPDWAFLHLGFLDFMGTQEQDSRTLVDHLSELINVPVITGRG